MSAHSSRLDCNRFPPRRETSTIAASRITYLRFTKVPRPNDVLGSHFPPMVQSWNLRGREPTAALSTNAVAFSSPAPRPPRGCSGVDGRSHRWFNGGSLWRLTGSLLGSRTLVRTDVVRTCHRERALPAAWEPHELPGARRTPVLPTPLAWTAPPSLPVLAGIFRLALLPCRVAGLSSGCAVPLVAASTLLPASPRPPSDVDISGRTSGILPPAQPVHWALSPIAGSGFARTSSGAIQTFRSGHALFLAIEVFAAAYGVGGPRQRFKPLSTVCDPHVTRIRGEWKAISIGLCVPADRPLHPRRSLRGNRWMWIVVQCLATPIRNVLACTCSHSSCGVSLLSSPMDQIDDYGAKASPRLRRPREALPCSPPLSRLSSTPIQVTSTTLASASGNGIPLAVVPNTQDEGLDCPGAFYHQD